MKSFLIRRRKITKPCVNPAADSDYDDNNILVPGRSFSGVFNAFVNQWCFKKIMYLGLHLGSMLSPKFLKSWKHMHIKNSIFNTTAKLKLLAQIIAFSQTAKLKWRGMSYLG